MAPIVNFQLNLFFLKPVKVVGQLVELVLRGGGGGGGGGGMREIGKHPQSGPGLLCR